MDSRFSKKETAIIASQLSMLLKSGVNIDSCLELLAQNESETKEKQDFFNLCRKSLANGASFSKAIEESGAFEEYFSKMCFIGERAGRLDEVLFSLADYYEKNDYMEKNVKSALRYPAIIAAVLFLVLGVMLIKVVPIFEGVYSSIGSSIPQTVRAFASTGEFLGRYGIFLLLFFGVVILAIVLYSKTPKGSLAAARLAEKSVFTRDMSRQNAAAKFSLALCVCLKSGLDIDEGIQMSKDLGGSPAMEKKISEMQNMMKQGESFPLALSKSGVFDPLYAGMAQVGIKSGMIDSAMETIAKEYTKEADEAAERSIAVIEPTIVIVISILIGALLLSVMLPLLSVMTAL